MTSTISITCCFLFSILHLAAQTVEDPVPSLPEGAYWTSQTLSLSSATENAVIFYTNDTSDPDSDSILYDSPFTLIESQSISAIATADSLDDSQVVTFDYEIGEMTSDGSNSEWKNMALPEQQNGLFQLSFTATPTNNTLDCVITLAPAPATAYTDCAVLCGFSSTGALTARNGSIYDAESLLNTVAGVSYTFDLNVDMANKTYDLEVTPDGGEPVLIAEDYAFRTEQASANELSYLSVVTLNVGSVQVGGLSLTSIPSVDSLSYEEWVTDQMVDSEISDAEHDPDRDGLNNLIEYFIGSNPNTPSKVSPIQFGHYDAGQINVSFQRARYVTGMSHGLFQSSNLANWTEVTDDLAPAEISSDPTLETFSLNIAAITADDPTMFYQLRVSLDDDGTGGGTGNGGGTGTGNGTGVAAELYPVAWESTVVLPDQDENGYSVLTPSANSRLIYVDEDGGNDSSAQFYSIADSVIGGDHQNPVGSINAYASISAAMDQAREGQDDWVMLQRGDVWTNVGEIRPRTGISRSERSVLTWYGSHPDRPEIRSANGESGLFWRYTNGSQSAIMGLSFYAATRDPDNAAFVGWAAMASNNSVGFRMVNFDDPMQSILIEDCEFAFYANNLIQQGSTNALTDVVLRRNLIRNNYSSGAHAQGIFSNNINGYLLEENMFYHNGWYRQGDSGSDNVKDEGQATFFNHNTYFSGSRNLIMRRNLFLASSSIQNKFTSNSGDTDSIKTAHILLYDNFYSEGEIVVSIGGNTDRDTGPRFEDVRLIANVATHIGDTRPTNRSLGWGFEIEDWQDGIVQGNILKDWGGNNVGNVWGIYAKGHMSGTVIQNNLMHELRGSSGRAYIDLEGVNGQNIDLNNNDFQVTENGMQAIDVTTPSPYNFFENNYWVNGVDAFSVDNSNFSYSAGVAALGESGSTNEQHTFVDSSRDAESYMESIGEPATLEALIARFRSQTALNPLGLTGKTINDYVREGMQEQ